ncbi:hypothetical protein, partial [uncultured Limosilactobacillus sp.]|uniref:hypothetical protein n=1 Tax=uncultured Limosilactobacillus sp. TaxID=2837629 RepID=UPI00259045A8
KIAGDDVVKTPISSYFASKGIRWLSKPKVSYCNCVPEQPFVNLAALIMRDINLTCYNVNIYYK